MTRPSANRFPFVLAALLSAAPAWAGELRVIDPSLVSEHWRLSGAPAAAPYPAQAQGSACVQLGFRIDRQGRVADPILLRAWSERPDPDNRQRDLFARHAVAALSQWRFEAADPQRRRSPDVFTSAGFLFVPAGGASAQAVREHCEIADLPRFVAEAQRRAGQRGSLLLSRMDAKREYDPVLIPFQKHDWFDGSIGPTVP